MKKVIVGDAKIVSQSTTEPIRHGGWQDPCIRCRDGILYVKFSGVKDCYEMMGNVSRDPVFLSKDCGETWEPSDISAWERAGYLLSNGDIVTFYGETLFRDLPYLPEIAKERKIEGPNRLGFYTREELLPVLGDRLDRILYTKRVKRGTETAVREECAVHYENMAYTSIKGGLIAFPRPAGRPRVDADGTVYLPFQGPYMLKDGTMYTGVSCVHMFRSTDNGCNFEYVSTVPYEKEYNVPNACEVEGFNESAFEILSDGTFLLIMRSGSLSPYILGSKEKPAPYIHITYSYDKGKTWTKPEKFYDYGVRPCSVKMPDGRVVLTSGRPDVYIRVSEDSSAKKWGEVIHILPVPEEDVYPRYFEYTCSNNDLCVYDEKTLFLTYSDFTRKTPEGVRAKSIIVRKITLED